MANRQQTLQALIDARDFAAIAKNEAAFMALVEEAKNS